MRDWYDRCSTPYTEINPDDFEAIAEVGEDLLEECDLEDTDCLLELNTGWKLVWAWNGAWMVIIGCNFLLLTLGSCFFWPRLIGTYLNCSLAFCSFAGAMMGIASVVSPIGRSCAFNHAYNTLDSDDTFLDEGLRYSDEYGVIFGLAFYQIILVFLQCCCCSCPLFCTPVKDAEHDKEKKEKKKKEKEAKKSVDASQQQMVPMQAVMMPG